MESKVEDIRWSKRSYTLRETLQLCSSPQLMKVSWVGEIPSDENQIVTKNRILRIHQVHIQTRVLASIKKNKWLSLPLRYADARFEVITNKKRSKPMYMRDVIDRIILPQEAAFYLDDDLHFDLHTAKGNVSERLSPLVLRNMYEVSYLQGNAIYNNHLDTQVVNIPLYLPVKVQVAEGFIKHTADNWRRYQALLAKLVSRHVTFELSPGIQNVTFFSDKRLEKAVTQEDYEKIPPTGTLYVTSARERLRSKATTATGVSGSRTVGHTPVPPPSTAQSTARAAPSSATTTRNGDVARPRQMPKSSSAAAIVSSDPRKASSPRDARQDFGARSRSANIATMPARAAHHRNHDHGKANLPVQPSAPPIPSTARPAKSNHAPNHVGNAVTQVDGRAPRGRDDRPLPLTTAGQAYRRRSPSVDATPATILGAQRRRSPSVGSRPEQLLLSPTGRIRKHPAQSHSPGIIARTPGSASSADSDYEHLKASLPVHIPPPDYDPNESIFQFPMENSKAQEAGVVPPTPPPVTTIPKTNRQTSVPQAAAPAPPSVFSAASVSSFSSPASSAASTPTAVAPPAPPPPPFEAPPPPQPPPAPVPPGIQGLAVPPPPPPPGLDWKPPGAQLQPAQITNPQPKPVVKSEPTMSSMMEELKKAQQRRMSRDIILEDVIDGGITNSSPKANAFNPKPQASQQPSELQSILSSRRASSNPQQPSTNRLPVAPRPKPGGIRGTNATTNNATFTKVEDIPNQLKGLTVAQISQCLKLLNLEKYVDKFKKNCIDGDLMTSLNKEMLRGDLGLTEFDIQKVMKFIQGWRPK